MITHRMVEAFRAVVQSGSVTRAAGLLNVSQPSVSRLVADLEARLDLRLFERRGTRLSATAAGLDLFDEVERSFTGLDRVREAALQIRSRQSGGLTIAAISALGYSLLPQLLGRMRGEATAPPLRLHIVPSQAALAMLALRQCDIAFASMTPAAEIGHPLARFQMEGHVILPPGRRTGGAIGPTELDGEPMVALVAHSLPRADTDRAFAAAGLRPNVVIETMQSFSAAQLVQAGLGFAVVDPMTAAAHVLAGGVSRPFLPHVDFSFGAYAWRPPGDLAWGERLVEMLRAEIATAKAILARQAG
jgi:DNA-binding transcriptional LysR family regulator